MTRVRLEIDEVTIYRPKKRWNLYFVVAVEHPDDKTKLIITTLPKDPIKLSKRHDNSFQFDTEEFGSEGLLVISRELPKERELNAHIYLRHTRKTIRNLGEILNDLSTILGGDTPLINEVIGTSLMPWLVVAKTALPLIGKTLNKIPDRDFGFLSAFERFGPEFEEQLEIDRKKEFSGNASLVYSWSVDE